MQKIRYAAEESYRDPLGVGLMQRGGCADVVALSLSTDAAFRATFDIVIKLPPAGQDASAVAR